APEVAAARGRNLTRGATTPWDADVRTRNVRGPDAEPAPCGCGIRSGAQCRDVSAVRLVCPPAAISRYTSCLRAPETSGARGRPLQRLAIAERGGGGEGSGLSRTRGAPRGTRRVRGRRRPGRS